MTVTVLPRRRGSSIRRHVGHVASRANAYLVIALLVVSVAVVALGLAAFPSGAGRRHQGQHSPSASAARCLTALATLDRGHGDFYRSVWCERYAGRDTAASYRFVGAPLPAFDPSGR